MYYTDKPKKNWIKIGSEMSQKTIDFDFPKFLDESYSEVPNKCMVAYNFLIYYIKMQDFGHFWPIFGSK